MKKNVFNIEEKARKRERERKNQSVKRTRLIVSINKVLMFSI